MKKLVLHLTDRQLEFAVILAQKHPIYATPSNKKGWALYLSQYKNGDWRFTSSWSQAGVIIDKEDILFSKDGETHVATIKVLGGKDISLSGPTKLVAAMRAFVSKYLGNEVYIPPELA